MDIKLQPYLENDLVLLRPLKEIDFGDLFKVASDPLIWEQHPDETRWTRRGFKKFFDESLASKGALVIIKKESEKIIGSSRFKIIDLEKGVVEIGWTFLSRDYWGGKYNSSNKKLMINYALNFVENVVFYVGENNFRSQRAIEKLGAIKVMDATVSWIANKSSQNVTYHIDKLLI